MIENVIYKFDANQIFTKEDFRRAVHEENSDYKESSINWLLGKLKSEYKIIKISKNAYCRIEGKRFEYRYPYSEELCLIVKEIKDEFPLLDFQVWELVQLNEFVNHQLAHNTLFIEVEEMLEESVFEFLKEKHVGVLLKPDVKEYYKYREPDNTIVIQKMVTEAPAAIKGTNFSRLEKILVDVLKDKLVGSMIDERECSTIFEDSFARYALDVSRIYRYASRRGAGKKVKDMMEKIWC